MEYTTTKKIVGISKNSLAVIIDKRLSSYVDLKKGDFVEIKFKKMLGGKKC